MAYDPFSRGTHPVGVRTFSWTEPARSERPLIVEVWYPAASDTDQDASRRDRFEIASGFPATTQEAFRGAAPASGTHPLVVFSHGFGSQRRQSTFLCTHWASHGYVVAAPDHTGNTIDDMIRALSAPEGARTDPRAAIHEHVTDRPADVSFVVDQLLEGAAGVRIADGPLAVSGHSFGGWTALAVAERDSRIRSVLPIAPAGGDGPLPSGALRAALTFPATHQQPTTYLTAELDSLLPLEGIRGLFAETKPPKALFVLGRADHMHFCDDAAQFHELFRAMPPPGDFARVARSVLPFSELCSEEAAHDFTRGLSLAHLDASLRDDTRARRFLTEEALEALAQRSVAAAVDRLD